MTSALSSAPVTSLTAGVESRLLRGGRVTKWKGKAASCAPFVAAFAASVSQMALVTALAVGGAISGTGTAEAACVAGPPGTFSCSGAEAVTQNLLGVPLVVNLDNTFNITTAAGNALTLTGVGGLMLTQSPGGGAIAGAVNGIRARNYGSGAMSITSTGALTGAVYDGINAANYGAGLSITAGGATTGRGDGIEARILGTGSLSVTSTGTAAGTIGYGIFALAGASATDITINAVNTNGGGASGISAIHNGAGVLSITSTGAATGAVYSGIRARNSANGSDLTIAALDASGRLEGIRADNYGSGDLLITTTGTATGTVSDGIKAYNSGTNLTIDAVNATGGNDGIEARNSGTGALSITSTGTVTGTAREGIYAINVVGTTDLTIVTNAVTGGRRGISAEGGGSGPLTITTNGAVTGLLAGIVARNNFASGDITITANGDVAGSVYAGIVGLLNSGNLAIVSRGLVTGSLGIVGRGYGNAGQIDIRTYGDVTAAQTGIFASTNTFPLVGISGISITTNAKVTGTARDGIYAFNRPLGISVDITANDDVSGGLNGIIARNYGSGHLAITATGAVTGTAYEGIYARNVANGTDLTITALDVAGGRIGIFGSNLGSGALDITATGTVIGQSEDGIRARTYGTDLTINAVDVSGGFSGILAVSLGSGALSITTTGTVTGRDYYGIEANNGGGGDAFIVNSGTIEGARAGIYAGSLAGRTTTISNTGTVQNLAASSTSLAIRSVGTVTNINNFDLVLGTVDLGNLADTFTNTGPVGVWDTAGGTNEFGDGADAVLNDGVVQAANDGGSTEITTFNDLESFRNNASGALRMDDGAVGDRTVLTGGAGVGNFTGNGGTVVIDTLLNAGGNPFADSDVLVIGGDSAGASTLFVSATGAGAFTPGDGILVVQVDGASNGVFSLGNAPLTAGAFLYKLFQGGIADPADGDWYLRSNFLSTIPAYESYAQVLLGLNNLPTLQQRVGNRFWAGEGNAVIAEGDGGPASAPEAAPSPEGAAASVEENAIWTRIEGAHGSYEPEVSTSGAAFDANQWKAQAGIDFLAFENGDGKLIGGLTAHYGGAAADVTATAGNGSIDATGYGLGATLTWYGNSGFYADAQASHSWYDSDLASADFGLSVEGNDGHGYALSIETGKRIDLNNGWTTTPQAQLVYSKVDFDDFTGPLGELVSLQQAESLRGRLGITADREASWQGDDGMLRRSHLYTIANLHYEFLDGTQIDVSGTSFSQRQDRLWGELGLGGSYNWADDKYSVYGEADISTSLANFADSTRISGTAGFRVKF